MLTTCIGVRPFRLRFVGVGYVWEEIKPFCTNGLNFNSLSSKKRRKYKIK